MTNFLALVNELLKKLVEVLGESAIDRIIDDPSVLEEVTVLNEKKRTSNRRNNSLESRDGASDCGTKIDTASVVS